MTTTFSVIRTVSYISRAGCACLDGSASVLFDKEMCLGTLISGSGCLHNRSGEGKKIVTRCFYLQTGRVGGVEFKYAGIQVGGGPFDRLGSCACFRYGGGAIRESTAFYQRTSFYSRMQALMKRYKAKASKQNQEETWMSDDVFLLRAVLGFSHDFLSGRLQRVVV